MKKVCSVSGGKTSAYMAANYEWDAYVFALVRCEDERLRFKDEGLRKMVEDRIQADFVGTNEDDIIVSTIFDLEQHIGKKIDWVTGPTFDEVIRHGGGIMPNNHQRYCTINLKIEPIFYWWHKNFDAQPIEMGLGYRANEGRRVANALSKVNEDGLTTMKGTFEKDRFGKNKWIEMPWRKPVFPLFEDRIYADEIHDYWNSNDDVVFAERNNCIHCFHRNALLLKKMHQLFPEKIQWASDMEKEKGYTWKPGVTYEKIIESDLQMEFDYSKGCEDGFCEIE
jgi:hypothetical protein